MRGSRKGSTPQIYRRRKPYSKSGHESGADGGLRVDCQGRIRQHSVAMALGYAAMIHQFRREVPATHERAAATMTLCTEQGFPFFLALGTILRGWAPAEQGAGEEGIGQI